MIHGFATAPTTATRARLFPDLSYRRLGRTGLWVSGAGFGCYRVAAGEATHETALYEALKSGINLIDTSTNYADGQSERLVGNVLARCIDEGLLDRDHVVVVSKAGYLQGENYRISQSHQDQGNPFPDLVKVDQGLEHCIHPVFLEDQLNRSLERLGLATLDVFLLHNPEYFLSVAEREGMDRKDAQHHYERRIQDAFAYLETEVVRGRIRAYGVSSNTFPCARDRYDFSDLERFWHLAGAISSAPRFQVIQFPMNLVETGAAVIQNQASGRTLLQASREFELGTLINRPLNAIINNNLVRLAEADTFFPENHPNFEALARQSEAIRQHAIEADPDWDAATLSQVAIRALVSTIGVGSVLVGMRKQAYVDDILESLAATIAPRDRSKSWSDLHIH